MQNNKTRSFYVLYSDKTWIFDQSECAQGPIYILHCYNNIILWSTDLLTIKQYIPCIFLHVVIYKLFFCKGFLPRFFNLHVIYRLNLHVIYRLPFSIFWLFIGSLFSIYMLFTGSLFQFTCYLQPPRLSFSARWLTSLVPVKRYHHDVPYMTTQ